VEIKTWLSALVGRIPMSANEALVVVVTGGGILLTVSVTGLTPKTGEAWFLWLLWVVVMVASAGLFVRGGYALLALGWLFVGRPAAGWIGRRLPFEFHVPVTRKAGASPLASPTLGALDFEQAATDAMTRMSRTLGKMTKDLGRSSAMIQSYVPRFEKLAAKDASTKAKIRLSRDFASRFDGFAKKLEAREEDLRRDTEAMASNFLSRIVAFPPGTDLTDLRATISRQRDIVTEARASQAGYKAAVIGMRAQNLEKATNEAADRHIAVVGKIISDFDRVNRFCTDALNEIDSRIPHKPSSRKARRRAKRP
jgi:hypothetical protein